MVRLPVVNSITHLTLRYKHFTFYPYHYCDNYRLAVKNRILPFVFGLTVFGKHLTVTLLRFHRNLILVHLERHQIPWARFQTIKRNRDVTLDEKLLVTIIG